MSSQTEGLKSLRMASGLLSLHVILGCCSSLTFRPPTTLPRQEMTTTKSKGAQLPYLIFKNALLPSHKQQPHPFFTIWFRACAHTHTHITKTSHSGIRSLICLPGYLSFLSSLEHNLLFWKITNIPQHEESSIVNSPVPNTQLQ